jgi:uncharacterized protein YciI
MLWIIDCTDRYDAAAKRQEFLVPHQKYLEAVSPQIFFSGPKQTDDGTKALGSVFVIGAKDREAAEAFIHNEPLFQAGVFGTVSVSRIRKRRLQPAIAEQPDA